MKLSLPLLPLSLKLLCVCESSPRDAESTPPTCVDNPVGSGEQSPNSGCRSGVCTKANMFSAEKSREHNYSFRKTTFYLTVRLEKSSHLALTSDLKIALAHGQSRPAGLSSSMAGCSSTETASPLFELWLITIVLTVLSSFAGPCSLFMNFTKEYNKFWSHLALTPFPPTPPPPLQSLFLLNFTYCSLTAVNTCVDVGPSIRTV